MKIHPVQVRLLEANGRMTEPQSVPKIVKSEAAWRVQLTPDQYRITRTHGTERAFCGVFHDNHKTGVYTCIGCGLPLFRSDAKFDSGTGWPSFFQPVAAENIGQTHDASFGMVRTEIHCVRCDSHLGHLFPDGPPPTRLRYCINSDALAFHERPPAQPVREKALLSGGNVAEAAAVVRELKGVFTARVGSLGAPRKQASPGTAAEARRGATQAIEIEFDPSQVTLDRLLAAVWERGGKRGANRSSPAAAGTPAGVPEAAEANASAVFFSTPEQESAAWAALARLRKAQPEHTPAVEITLAAGQQLEE